MKALKSTFSIILCFLLLLPMTLLFSTEVNAQESSSPRHIVMLRFGGLNSTVRGSDIRSQEIPRLSDYGILHVASLEQWLKPFLDDGNLFGFWSFTGIGNSWMPDGYASYLWDDWDKMMSDFNWNNVECSLFGDRVGPGPNTISYFKQNAEIYPSDIVTIINIGNFQEKYDFYYGKGVEPSDSFYTEASAMPYHIDNPLLRSAAEEEHNHVFRGANRTIEEHIEILVGQEYLTWENTNTILNSWPSEFNVISVYVHDDLDEYRSGADVIRKLLGIQHLKDIQDSGYFEIHYLDVIEFLNGLFPVIQSTKSSAELQELIGNDSLFGTNSAPELPIKQTIVFEDQTLDVKFSESYFSLSSSEYNHELAKFSMGLCATTYNGTIESNLACFGFTDFRTFELEDNLYKYDTVKAYLARKVLKDGTELISITGCGTQGDEWAQYLKYLIEIKDPYLQSENGVYRNFQLASANLYAEIVDFCGGDLSGKKFLLTGHSRGAAVTNLASYILNQVISPEDVYCYTFATPNTHLAGHPAPKSDNIFNIVDAGDLVSQLPPGGSKSGKVYGYNAAAAGGMALTGSLNLVYGVVQHTPQNYVRLLSSGEAYEEFYYHSWRWVDIHCETDVRILNFQGEIVASVINNVVDPNSQCIVYTNDNGEKTVLLPTNQFYTVHITGRADGGVMEYSVYQLQGRSFERTVEPMIVNFDKGDVFFAEFDGYDTHIKIKEADFIKKIELRFGDDFIRNFIIVVVSFVLALIIICVIIRKLKKRKRHYRY